MSDTAFNPTATAAWANLVELAGSEKTPPSTITLLQTPGVQMTMRSDMKVCTWTIPKIVYLMR